MKILMILPEFDEGGVERHVLWLSTELSKLGQTVWIVTAGGRLEAKLPPGIRVLHLPVHRKNPLTALTCALRIAALCRRERFSLIHAHSRVPAWIAWWASRISGKPWVFTAHACYRKNAGIRPFREADGAICVSETVRTHLKEDLPPFNRVISNGIPEMKESWQPGRKRGVVRFLFVGRLTRLKGLQVVLEALAAQEGKEWGLDIVGDGPLKEELASLVKGLGLADRVNFRGFQDDVGSWMVASDCLLFPSLQEGMPLTLMQAVRVGIPVLASGIEPVKELVGCQEALVAAGDVRAWANRLAEVLREETMPPRFDPALVPTAKQMAEQTLAFLENVGTD